MTLPSDKSGRLLSAPIEVWEKIDAAIKFYAGYETYMPPRTGGVMQGCPRSGPSPISLDRGKFASEVLTELVKLYPLAEGAPSSIAPKPEPSMELRMLRDLIAHWHEFGPEHGLDEKIESYHRALNPPFVTLTPPVAPVSATLPPDANPLTFDQWWEKQEGYGLEQYYAAKEAWQTALKEGARRQNDHGGLFTHITAAIASSDDGGA